MDQETYKKIFLVGFIICVILGIVFVFSILNFIYSEGYECMEKPVKYYENNTESKCVCYNPNNYYGGLQEKEKLFKS